jgi:hypothetical protein
VLHFKSNVGYAHEVFFLLREKEEIRHKRERRRRMRKRVREGRKVDQRGGKKEGRNMDMGTRIENI